MYGIVVMDVEKKDGFEMIDSSVTPCVLLVVRK